MCPSFPESNMLIFGIQHFRKLSTKKIIFFKKIHAFLPLANCVEIGSSFFLFIQYTKNLPLYLKQTPFIQKRLFILISLHHSSHFFFLSVPYLAHTPLYIACLIIVFLVITLIISITVTETPSKIGFSDGLVWT